MRKSIRSRCFARSSRAGAYQVRKNHLVSVHARRRVRAAGKARDYATPRRTRGPDRVLPGRFARGHASANPPCPIARPVRGTLARIAHRCLLIAARRRRREASGTAIRRMRERATPLLAWKRITRRGRAHVRGTRPDSRRQETVGRRSERRTRGDRTPRHRRAAWRRPDRNDRSGGVRASANSAAHAR